MNLDQLTKWLDANLNTIEACCGGGATASTRALFPLLQKQPTMTVSRFVAQVGKVKAPRTGCDSLSSSGKIVAYLVAGAKPVAAAGNLRDLQKFSKLLQSQGGCEAAQWASMAMEALAPPAVTNGTDGLSESALSSVVRRLETALGDHEGFTKEHRELNQLSAADLKKVAKQFARKSSRSKAAALDAIWLRHSSLMGARERHSTTSDRSAA